MCVFNEREKESVCVRMCLRVWVSACVLSNHFIDKNIANILFSSASGILRRNISIINCFYF